MTAKAPTHEGTRAKTWRWESIVIPAAMVLVLASTFNFLNANAVWLRPFGRDLWRWLIAPGIAGGPSIPVGLPLWVGTYALAGTAAWFGSAVSLRSTVLADDKAARIGVSIILAVAIVGYAGIIAIVLGQLESPFLWALLVGVAAAALTATVLVKARRADADGATTITGTRITPAGSARVRWLGWSLSGSVLFLSTVHAVMAPVTETDATIYHAGAARLWFLGRPDPGLVYGPSVGIEISANYPPLFPANGAAIYTLVGQFDDVYLRLVSPLLAAGLLLVLFAYARWHSGRTVAWWVVVVALGSPLLLMYAVWPTNYMLLSGLILSVLMYCQLGATSNRLAPWGTAGGLAGLAILTNFYGWITFGFAVLAALIWMRSRRALAAVALFATVAGVVAAPWLIRNWVLLGDPMYPLGNGLFHDLGLVQPLWNASQIEIKKSALSFFAESSGGKLVALEVFTALQSSYLIPTGLAAGLLVGLWRSWSGDLRNLYLTAATLLFLAAVLAPGWYWLRALLPVVPIGALLIGLTIERANKWAHEFRHAAGLKGFGAGLWQPILGVVGALSLVVGVSLSFAGPNQETWTTNLDQSADFLKSVRNLGSSQEQLATAFDGDYECWVWLNHQLGPNERVATFELRVYYFDHPENVFYLDGLEARPLLSLTTPDAVRQFLAGQEVRYIMIPAWAVAPTPARHPTVDLLPMMSMLGTPEWFPLIALFGDTAVYGVLSPNVASGAGT